MGLKPISEIKADLGIEPNGKVQRFFTNTCYRHMDKYVPKETGDLRKMVRMEADSITYNSPYAHYQYIGKVYVDPETGKACYYSEDYGYWSRPGVKKVRTERNLVQKTPGTCSRWDRKMVSAEMQDVVKEVQEYIKKRG